MGRRWYEDGKFAHKVNSFTDFVACARHLVTTGRTVPEQLAARGGSAGGLLVGAVANLAPELFRAIAAQVPFVDPLNTLLDPTLPLTVVEWEEWGNPVDDEQAYRWIKGYSPYENVRSATYPAILATAGLNDPRVGFHEPAKWVARLRIARRAAPMTTGRSCSRSSSAPVGGSSGRYRPGRRSRSRSCSTRSARRPHRVENGSGQVGVATAEEHERTDLALDLQLTHRADDDLMVACVVDGLDLALDPRRARRSEPGRPKPTASIRCL